MPYAIEGFCVQKIIVILLLSCLQINNCQRKNHLPLHPFLVELVCWGFQPSTKYICAIQLVMILATGVAGLFFLKIKNYLSSVT